QCRRRVRRQGSERASSRQRTSSSSLRGTSPPPATSSPPSTTTLSTPSPLPLATLLLGHLLSRRRVREAASVVRWICRPNSPQRPNNATFTFVVAAGGLDGDDGDRASVAW
ncbi:Os03g0673600, partial [Oryza sativa Japonica Group]